MKKRNLLVAALSLCLVAVIAVGGTLAYFTDQTQTMTNTFTSGEVDIVLWESGDPDGDGNPEILDNTTIGGHGDRTYTGIKFDDIVPGDVLDKNMNISVSDNSVFSYVAVHLWVEGEGLTDEQNALAYELIENAVTRRPVKCAGIPATPEENVFTEPTTTTPSWTAFRLEDGSFLLVASGKKQGLADTDGDGKNESITAPLNHVPAGITLNVFDRVFIGEPNRMGNGAEPDTYGNELAGLNFQLKTQAFAIQAEHLPEMDGSSWTYFADMVVDACNNGTEDKVFDSYKDDNPFNKG